MPEPPHAKAASVYRDEAPRSIDLETTAIRDLLARTKQLRRRVALPTMAASLVAAWLGGAAHALGYWPLLGVSSSGTYLVSAFTLAIAAVLSAAPLLAPGVLAYFVARRRMRAKWSAEYRAQKTADAWPDRDEWLARTAQRFP